MPLERGSSRSNCSSALPQASALLLELPDLRPLPYTFTCVEILSFLTQQHDKVFFCICRYVTESIIFLLAFKTSYRALYRYV
jgi:hypothetical protein